MNYNKWYCCMLIFLFSLSKTIYGEVNLSQIPTTKEKENYCVYTNDWFFVVPNLKGWNFTEVKNERLNGFYSFKGTNFSTSPAVIYIKVLKKNTLNISTLLKQDMDNFTKITKGCYFQKYSIENKHFQTYSEIYIYNDLVDFVSYLDPGEKYDFFSSDSWGGGSSASEDYKDFSKIWRRLPKKKIHE